MIIKGKSRSGPAALAKHLDNAEMNERVSLIETRGTVAQDLRGALIEMDAYGAGTRCQKSLYHAAISPEPPHILTPEQRTEAIDALEKKLGLDEHARVVVMHEKLGRQHIHVVWSRIDLDRMVSVSDSHNYRKHEEVSRDLERRFGHDRVQGAHHEREGVERPDRTPSRAELRQEERTGIKGKEVKAEVTALFRASDNAEAFEAALADHGYKLAKGDRRDFVIVDRAGGIHSLARRIDGMKAAELRAFMGTLDPQTIPSIEQAKEVLEERKRQAEAHQEAKLEAAYARGDDYVSQTRAALKEHKQRQQALNDDRPKPQRPAERSEDEKDAARRRDDDDRRRRAAQEDSGRQSSSDYHKRQEAADAPFNNVEITERLQRLRDRYAGLSDGKTGTDHSHDAGPDKQREAPGGGHTRSR
jgi:hypothetical protein